ncbi:restriction endonuclease subunit S [Paenibacillus sp. MABNR03]|uniref:restriction endonuclease subunit S n=1 Tax=Paenibacillus sp. MABNR03 TaxID=3142626 RepID=UPI003D27B950
MKRSRWREVQLGEIVTMGANTGNRYYVGRQGEQKIVGHRSLADDPMLTDDDLLLEDAERNKEYILYPKGTILVSLGRHSRGVGFLQGAALAEITICGIRVDVSDVLPEYLFYVLRWYRMKQAGRWSQRRLKSWPIPLPPSIIQRDIVKFLLKLEEIQQSRKRLITMLSDYIKAQYDTIILKESTYQPRSKLSDWIYHVEVGRQIPEHILQEGIWYWKGRPDPFRKAPRSVVVQSNPIERTRYSGVFSEPGDILWYRYANERTEGSVLVHRWERPVVISNEWIKVTPLPGIPSEFLAAYIKENYQRAEALFQYRDRGRIADMIKQLPTVVPSKNEQEEYAAIARATEQMANTNLDSLHKLNILYENYMEKMFGTDMIDGRGEEIE